MATFLENMQDDEYLYSVEDLNALFFELCSKIDASKIKDADTRVKVNALSKVGSLIIGEARAQIANGDPLRVTGAIYTGLIESIGARSKQQ